MRARGNTGLRVTLPSRQQWVSRSLLPGTAGGSFCDPIHEWPRGEEWAARAFSVGSVLCVQRDRIIAKYKTRRTSHSVEKSVGWVAVTRATLWLSVVAVFRVVVYARRFVFMTLLFCQIFPQRIDNKSSNSIFSTKLSHPLLQTLLTQISAKVSREIWDITFRYCENSFTRSTESHGISHSTKRKHRNMKLRELSLMSRPRPR